MKRTIAAVPIKDTAAPRIWVEGRTPFDGCAGGHHRAAARAGRIRQREHPLVADSARSDKLLCYKGLWGVDASRPSLGGMRPRLGLRTVSIRAFFVDSDFYGCLYSNYTSCILLLDRCLGTQCS